MQRSGLTWIAGPPTGSASSGPTALGSSPRPGPRPWRPWSTSCGIGCRPSGRTRMQVLSGDRWMAHSLLSAPLNLGLLDPLEVVRAAEDAYTEGHAPIASVEGFVRQVIGWRDYIWHLYWYLGEDYRFRNDLGADRQLPGWLLDLDPAGTEANCLQQTLTSVRDHGWTHHIPRLDDPRELRHAARLRPGGVHRLVPPQLRRRLRLGDGAERGRHVAARGRRVCWPPSRMPPAGPTSTR